MCCGPLVFRECPRCGNKVICDRQEMREEYEDASREMAGRVDVAIREGRISEAKKMLKELSQLNQCLNSAPLDDFIRAARRRIRQAGAAPA